MKSNNGAQAIVTVIMAYVLIYLVSYGVGYCISRLVWMYHFRKQHNNFKDFYENFKKQQWNNGSHSMGMSVDDACKILGIKKKDLKNMSKDDLKRAYWKKAQEVHPDKPSGSADTFKNVNNAYSHIKEACYA